MKKTAQIKSTKTRHKYDDAYKQQALDLLRLGQSVPTVAQALGIGQGVLYKWKQAQRPAALDQELEQLRQRLKQVETERDILKKALSIFCRPT
jgi:transposase